MSKSIMKATSQKDKIKNKTGKLLLPIKSRISQKNILKENSGEYFKDDIEIFPTFMTFKKPKDGIQCRKRLTIKNIGLKVVNIQILRPTSLAFHIEVIETRTILHPGLSLQIWINYSFDKFSPMDDDYLPIKINDNLVNYRLVFIIRRAHIVVEPIFLDFDQIDINCESKSKIVTIRNDGKENTEFSVDVTKENIDIIILPNKGTINAGSEINLRVKVIGLKEGTFDGEFWIKSCENIRVSLKVIIIVPKFQADHPNSIGNSILIDFPKTFVNNLNHETFIVRNLSTRNIHFLVVGEINEELVHISEIDECKYLVYGVFKISPTEGTMKPFESKIFTVSFFPAAKTVHPWNEAQDFLTFFKILRFFVSELEEDFGVISRISQEILPETLSQNTSMKADSEYSTMKNESDFDSIILCLYGKVERAELIFSEDKLYFGDIKIDEKISRIISVFNPSTENTLSLRFLNNPNARCNPKEGILKPKKSLQLVIEVKGKIELQSKFHLKFEATAKTFNDYSGKKKTKRIFSYKIKCFLNLLMGSKKEWKPKLTTGFDSLSETDFCNLIKLPKVKSDFSLVKPSRDVEKKLLPNLKSQTSSLSTFELYKIKISPQILDFGKLVSNSIGYKQIEFENRNNFSIMIRLIRPITEQITFQDENAIILRANEKIGKFVKFHANEEREIITSCFNYQINENHSFSMKIIAEIVDKYLKIDKTEIFFGKGDEINFGNFTYIEMENQLNVDIGFSWNMESESTFTVVPSKGFVRKNRKLFVHVSYDSDPFKSNQTKITMSEINENKTSKIELKLKMQLTIPKVVFLENFIDFGKIPLNVPVENFAVLHNSDFSPATFVVDQNSLIHGIQVSPSSGVIQSKGIKILQITVNFKLCVEFALNISIIVQRSHNLKLKITGQVEFPNLKLVPDYLKIRQFVCSNDRQVHLISVINQGETKVKLQFLLDKYPEFAVTPLNDEENVYYTDDGIIIDQLSTANFHLHFNPINPISYSLHLPILINNIIGPTNLKNTNSQKPSEYLKSKNDEYSKITGITFLKLPQKLSNILIDCTAINQAIKFNNLNFHFDTSLNLIEDEFVISNQSQDDLTFTIKTKCFHEKSSLFRINWISGQEPIINIDYIICKLSPKEGTIFNIKFQPLYQGTYKLEAPIILQDQLEGNFYNILKIEGNNPKCTIESQIEKIYFTPLPLNIIASKNFTLTTKNFPSSGKLLTKIFNSGKIIGSFKNETLRINFPGGNLISIGRTDIKVEIELSNSEPVSFCVEIEFFDDRKLTSLLITIYGNVNNSLLTIYPHELEKYTDLMNTKNGKYEFLVENEVKMNKSHVEETITIVEEWLFSDIFGFEFYPEIPNGIIAAVSDIIKKSKNTKLQSSIKKKEINYSIFSILEFMIGDNFRSYIQMPDSLPENNSERVEFLLEKYSKILQFLCDENEAFLVHVSPIFLLCYNDYLIIEKSQRNQTLNCKRKILLSKEKFESKSRQCWLDIILQIYKCFKFSHMREEDLTVKKQKIHENRHFSEEILLKWLQFHYEEQINMEWLKNSNDAISIDADDDDNRHKLKLIDNFDTCLEDGLIFIAITGAYCPFLIKEFFQNIYISPKNSQEELHNAICVIAAWKKIRLGFLVKPMQIVRPNCVHMLMLITHLHKVLETYLTKTKIQFNCPLTKSITKEITVTNPTEKPVNFVTQFFENDAEFFSIVDSQKIIKLNSRQSKKISITFNARIFQETKAYLVICGFSIGPNFAPNQTFQLEGITSHLVIVDEQIITSKMYQILDALISIKVPYKNEAVYNISLAENEPKDFLTLKRTPWTELKKRKIPRRLFLNQKCLIVAENAFLANLSITIGTKTPETKNFWLIFESEYNDFIIKITSVSRTPILQLISINWTLDFCICSNPPNKINENCPLNIKIKIPSKNVQLWECVKQMLRKILTNKDWCFWSRILDTNFGVKVIQWFQGNQQDSLTEISHLFQLSNDYNVSISEDGKFLNVPDKLSISDVHTPEGETEVNFHISHQTPKNYETILKLTSSNGMEIRNFKVKFQQQS